MYISKVLVTSYKSYLESGEIEFKPGFNVVVGQNSAGKTALLETMQLQFLGNPHRSLKTVPAHGDAVPLGSSVRLTFVLTRQELLHLLKNSNYMYAVPTFKVPNFGDFARSPAVAHAFLRWLFDKPEFRVTIQCSANAFLMPVDDPLGWYRAAPLETDGQQMFMRTQSDASGMPAFAEFSAGNSQYDVTVHLASRLRQRIYRFWAERFNFGDWPVGTNRILRPNAENLPEVLDLLKANTARMERFNHVAREILPQVRHVSVSKIPSSPAHPSVCARILVWPHDYQTEREDLANPLNECGSGVGQVLAILYVVMNSNEPQVILIDEPQSFLHPGAVRKLFEVLKDFPQHQYIITTHSPAVIAAADPATLTIARAIDGESKLESVDPSSAKHARAYLAEVGARLSDVFGADDIIWAEGQTEEECFPLILRRVAKRSLMGTAVVGIRQTSSLQGRDRKKMLEIHHKMSEANTLLPPTIAFVFDEECLAKEKKEELQKMAPGRIHFLPRRMYENYLLDPEAIAEVVNKIPDFREQPVSADEVRQWLDKKRDERVKGDKSGSVTGQQLRYFCKGTTQVPANWEQKIDAGRLLEDLFEELSETRVSFEKTSHSVVLTEWLIEHRPTALQEIADFLNGILMVKSESKAISA
jgi:predicted ATPase